MLDKKQLKEKLEKERDALISQLTDIGIYNEKTNEWEAVPENQLTREADQNDMADRFEEYESRGSMVDVLVDRLSKIEQALENLNKKSFGKCEVCGQDIETARLEVNPAATTCKEHLEDEI